QFPGCCAGIDLRGNEIPFRVASQIDLQLQTDSRVAPRSTFGLVHKSKQLLPIRHSYFVIFLRFPRRSSSSHCRRSTFCAAFKTRSITPLGLCFACTQLLEDL